MQLVSYNLYCDPFQYKSCYCSATIPIICHKVNLHAYDFISYYQVNKTPKDHIELRKNGILAYLHCLKLFF